MTEVHAHGAPLPGYLLHEGKRLMAKSEDQHITYPVKRALGIVLAQVGHWAVVKFSPTTQPDLEVGSVLSGVNGRPTLHLRYKEAMNLLVGASWPLQLSFRRPPHLDGMLDKRPRSKSNKKYRARYFVLRAGVLRYYTKKGGPLKGLFELEDARVHWPAVAEGKPDELLLTRSDDMLRVRPDGHAGVMSWGATLYYAIVLANGGARDAQIMQVERSRWSALVADKERWAKLEHARAASGNHHAEETQFRVALINREVAQARESAAAIAAACAAAEGRRAAAEGCQRPREGRARRRARRRPTRGC